MKETHQVGNCCFEEECTVLFKEAEKHKKTPGHDG
jgi:hypothetical protein